MRRESPCPLARMMIAEISSRLDAQGITQNQWAEQMNLHKSYMSELFNGKRSISLDRLFEWGEYLGCEWTVRLKRRRRRRT